MISNEQLAWMQRLETIAPALNLHFTQLTRAHLYFQGCGGLRSISVSDVMDNGSIEATFVGTRIKFELMLIFGPDRRPRGRVVCVQCHCHYGTPVQGPLGSFSFDEDGVTDLDPGPDGHFPGMESHSAAIVLRFLDAAFAANKQL